MQNRFIALAFLGTILGTLLITGCSQETRQQDIVQSDASSNSVPNSSLLDGRPNLNGVWKAINTANWNLEAHSAEALDDFWQMGAIAAIPAGKSVLSDGGTDPLSA